MRPRSPSSTSSARFPKKSSPSSIIGAGGTPTNIVPSSRISLSSSSISPKISSIPPASFKSESRSISISVELSSISNSAISISSTPRSMAMCIYLHLDSHLVAMPPLAFFTTFFLAIPPPLFLTTLVKSEAFGLLPSFLARFKYFVNPA